MLNTGISLMSAGESLKGTCGIQRVVCAGTYCQAGGACHSSHARDSHKSVGFNPELRADLDRGAVPWVYTAACTKGQREVKVPQLSLIVDGWK